MRKAREIVKPAMMHSAQITIVMFGPFRLRDGLDLVSILQARLSGPSSDS